MLHVAKAVVVSNSMVVGVGSQSCPLSLTFLNDLPFLIPQLDLLTMIS